MILGLDKKRIIECDGFLKTFDLYTVYDDWVIELYNYFIMGYEPGSFHKALLANDLNMAAIRSHPSNTWTMICGFAKWVYANAPSGSAGSHENVNQWLKMTRESQREICEQKGWLLTEKELSWKLLEMEG